MNCPKCNQSSFFWLYDVDKSNRRTGKMHWVCPRCEEHSTENELKTVNHMECV